MYGPLVMTARLDEQPRDMWYRHFAADEKVEPAPILQFTGGSWTTRRAGWSLPSTNSRSVLPDRRRLPNLFLCRASSPKGTPYTTKSRKRFSDGTYSQPWIKSKALLRHSVAQQRTLRSPRQEVSLRISQSLLSDCKYSRSAVASFAHPASIDSKSNSEFVGGIRICCERSWPSCWATGCKTQT